MDKIGIIILSDLHFTRDVSKCKLSLREPEFLTKFLVFINKQMQDNGIRFKYLLMAGDLVESGKRAEYEGLKEILNEILIKLEIKKEHVLMVPGNHDLARDVISNYCDREGIPEEEAYQYMDIKFQNYIEFYKDFKGISDYSLDKAIIDRLDFEECNISVLGVNSNVKESHRPKDHTGYVDEQKLMGEIKSLGSGRHYFVLSHHSWSDDRQSELPTIENADSTKAVFRQNNIMTYMYGHHHALDCKKIEDRNGESRYYEIGSFSKVLSGGAGEAYNNVFVTAVIDAGFPKLLLSKYVLFQNDWTLLSDRALNELTFGAEEHRTGETIEHSDGFMEIAEDKESDLLQKRTGDLTVGEDSEKYLGIIAENKLYREGHYHWSNGEKTRGWINISAFLGNHVTLSNLRKDFKRFYTMIQKNGEKVDAVIGYGMEGNIVGSSLTPFLLKKDIRYLYYPSVHKGKNYIEAEKITWNQATQVENIIFIFDFVPPDNYIQEIIGSGKIFANVKKMFVFSIFSIRIEESSSPDVIVVRVEESGKNKVEQKILVRHYVACRLEISECKMDMTQCPICTNHFAEVIKL